MAEQLAKPIVESPPSDWSCSDLSAALVTNVGLSFPLKTKWTRLGRGVGNELILPDDGFASRYHAWIIYEQDNFWIEDLGSTNGTILNGQPLLETTRLFDGDKIKIGDSEMTFKLLDKTRSQT